jgi:hypothetical protein
VKDDSDAIASRERPFTSSLLSHVVIAGLDPAIHAAAPRTLTKDFVFGDSA